MAQRTLRDFLKLVEQRGQLRRITAPVNPDLEVAAIADRVLAMGGPALLFENVIGSPMPLVLNLLGTVERVVWSMGLERVEQLEELGSRLALLQQPRPPKGLQETAAFGRVLWDLVKARPDFDLFPPCQQIVQKGDQLNLDQLPLIRPWPGGCWPSYHPWFSDHSRSRNTGSKCWCLSLAATGCPFHDGALAQCAWWCGSFA